MPSLLQELRYSARFLLRERGFTLVMVLTLTVGVGASSSLFSVLNGVLLEPLPYPDSEELVFFRTDFGGGKNHPAILRAGVPRPAAR